MSARLDYSTGTKVCADCLAALPLADFPLRDGGTRTHSTCRDCTRRRWRTAHDRGRAIRGLVVGTRKPRVVDLAPSFPKPDPYFPPTDFLDLGPATVGAALVWGVGIPIHRSA